MYQSKQKKSRPTNGVKIKILILPVAENMKYDIDGDMRSLL